MLLLGLLFVGCKRLEEPNPEAPQNATIEKIKAWYNPKIERLKGAKSTGIDIYYPQWEQGLIHNLPNGEKIAVFPVMRERRILYFNTGFVRKFVVRLTANDSIQGVKLVEMIGKKEYLREYQEEVVRRHCARTAQGMPVLVIERPVPLYVNKSDPCINCNPNIIFWYEIDGGGFGMGFNIGGNFSFYDLVPSNPSIGTIDGPPSGGFASGYGTFMGWYGDTAFDPGGSGGGASPTPDNAVYVDWNAIGNIGNVDWSAGWGSFTMPPFDFGISFGSPIFNIPSDISPELLAIIDVLNSNMTNEEWKALDEAFTQARTSSCLFDAMYKTMKANQWKFKWKSYNAIPQPDGATMFGYYDGSKKEIGLSKKSFEKVDDISPLGNVIAEELFHAYQDVYSTYTNSGYDDIPRDGANAFKGFINIEVEAKFFVDLTFQMTMMNTTPAYGQSRHTFEGLGAERYAHDFEKWIEDITNNHTQMPQNYQAFQGQYFQWVEKFKDAYKNTVYDTPIDYTKTPNALLNLIQISGCNN